MRFIDNSDLLRLLASMQLTTRAALLDATIKMLPCRSAIVDGELHGSLLDLEGRARPASVYEVYGALQGERPLQLRYAAFDLIYLDGEDLTRLPLLERLRLELSPWPA